MERGRRDDPRRILKRGVRIALAAKSAVGPIAQAHRGYVARALAISQSISRAYLRVSTRIGDVGPTGGGPHRHRVNNPTFFEVLRSLTQGGPHGSSSQRQARQRSTFLQEAPPSTLHGIHGYPFRNYVYFWNYFELTAEYHQRQIAVKGDALIFLMQITG